MPRMISAQFKSRRDAEMAIEHIVQDHGLDRNAVEVGPASNRNTAGTEAARADVEDGHLKTDTEGEPALAGKIKVSVQVEDDVVDKVLVSFRTFDGDIAA